MTPDAEPAPRPRLRWGRIWFSVALLTGGAAGFAWWAARPPETGFEVRLWAPMAGVLEREADLVHPPDPDAERFEPRRFEGDRLRARLRPGHYRLTLRPEGAPEPFTMPLLVDWEGGTLTWDLGTPPPPGFVPVPGGAWLEGRRGPVRRSEAPFWAARFEVSRADYAAFLQALETTGPGADGFHACDGEAARIAFPGGCPGHGSLARLELDAHPERARWPVSFVNWYDAEAYCNWLTESRGAGRWRFRLPTSSEWQKLSRGTDGRHYPWGDVFRRDPFREAQDLALQAVDALPERRSPYGIYQTEGNVAEWTADAADPAAVRRVVRGRSWNSSGDLVRIGAGLGDPATRRAPEIGFRPVAEPVRPGSAR